MFYCVVLRICFVLIVNHLISMALSVICFVMYIVYTYASNHSDLDYLNHFFLFFFFFLGGGVAIYGSDTLYRNKI